MTIRPISKISTLVACAAFLPVILNAQELASPAAEMVANASSTSILESMPPELKFTLVTLGSGGIAGWAVGFTLKKFAKLAALIVGVAFISIQYLAFHQYITIDWDKIKHSVPEESIEQSWVSVMSVLTYNLPFAGAFLVGFWMGFRKG